MTDEKRVKSKEIRCRVTPDEYLFFQNKIKEANLTMSDYMRKLIFEGRINIIQPISVIKMQRLNIRWVPAIWRMI